HGIADEARAVGGFLDLGGADPIAGGFDHLVAPSDIVKEALGVGDDDVAGKHRPLGRPPGLGPAGYGPEALGGALGVVPVSLRDQRAAMDEFAFLARTAEGAI